MAPRHEARLTWGLCLVCLALGLATALPRWFPTPRPYRLVSPELTVAVAGAVREPGSYTLPFGARVADLIEAAGGLSPDAEASLVNPARPLTAGAQLVVPRARTDTGDPRISLNEASLQALDTLPGVGPATAGRIVAARPYARVEDLLRVRGIGERTLERLRPLVRP